MLGVHALVIRAVLLLAVVGTGLVRASVLAGALGDDSGRAVADLLEAGLSAALVAVGSTAVLISSAKQSGEAVRGLKTHLLEPHVRGAVHLLVVSRGVSGLGRHCGWCLLVRW